MKTIEERLTVLEVQVQELLAGDSNQKNVLPRWEELVDTL